MGWAEGILSQSYAAGEASLDALHLRPEAFGVTAGVLVLLVSTLEVTMN